MASASAPSPQDDSIKPQSNMRWWICALLFFATTINYVDRNSLSVLKTTLEKALNWSDVDYGWITFAFTTSYAIFPSLVGRVIDKFGVKFSFAAALVLWSIMAAAHALVRGVVGFSVARFFLGAAEAANFPASIKAVSQWFPQKERALATGIFNSGANVGVMISFVAVWIAETVNWQAAFIAIGAIGFIWLIFWQMSYDTPEKHPKVSKSELEYIKSGLPKAEEKMNLPWTSLLRFGNIWPFLIAKLLTDPVWWFYLYWLPSYLEKERGRNPLKSAMLLILIYTGASLGSILGGWISGHLIGKGWKIGSARLLAMFVAAVCMPGSIMAYYTNSFALCIALISLATACHQGWSANVFTSATDMFPSKVAGSVVGLGATTGAIGGMFMSLLAALSIQWSGTQQYVFIWAGLMHPLAFCVYWFWLGKNFKKEDVDRALDTSPHRGLLTTGGIVSVTGAVLTLLIYGNWGACVAAAKLSGAAQAVTAAVGVTLIGAILIYAGMGKQSASRTA